MIVDAFEFSRQAKRAEGSVATKDLPRLEVVERGDRLAWVVTGSTDERRRPFLRLTVTGAVQLVCQRCMQPVELPVVIDARYLVAQSDAEADAVPPDEDRFDVIVGSKEMDLLELVEDEIILSLPLVPKHQHCVNAVGGLGNGTTSARQATSPFAVLAGLKKEDKGQG